MSKPNEVMYVLLGGVTSNLAHDAYPFVIVVSESFGDSRRLKSYVLNGWQDINESFSDEVRDYVLSFLDELASYRTGEDAKRFFAHLHIFSVGPIRFITGGACHPDKLDESLSALLEGGKARILWPESFKAIQSN